MAPFEVGLTPDGLLPDGRLPYEEYGLATLEINPDIAWRVIETEGDLTDASDLSGLDALLLFGVKVDEVAIAGASDRLAIIARLGVGYDNVPITACTEQGVAVSITPDAIRLPMAVATMTLALAVSQKLLFKERLVRDGRWDERRMHLGVGLCGTTFSLIGLGHVGTALVDIARPLGVRFLAFDPYVPIERVPPDVEIVPLEVVLSEADVLFVLCPLNPDTRGLINEAALGRMKSTAFLINTARGPIVDSLALAAAISSRRIAGAGLDVVDPEPLPADHPLLECENVVLTPHSLCWTDQCFFDMGVSACRAILSVAEGQAPAYVVNGDVLTSKLFETKLQRRSRDEN